MPVCPHGLVSKLFSGRQPFLLSGQLLGQLITPTSLEDLMVIKLKCLKTKGVLIAKRIAFINLFYWNIYLPNVTVTSGFFPTTEISWESLSYLLNLIRF